MNTFLAWTDYKKGKSNIIDDPGPSVRFQLSNIRRNNFNKIISACLNINSLPREIDILTVSESKLNNSFPDSQLFSDGIEMEETNALFEQWYSIENNFYWKVIDWKLYCRIKSKKLEKLLNCSCNPTNENIESHLDPFSKTLDINLNKYGNMT